MTLRRLFLLNPILEEATRARRKFFRVSGGPGKGLSYVAVAIIALIYLWIVAEVMLSRGDMSIPILYLQLIAVTLIMPVSLYGAISGERERTTWEALILTRLTPGQIVIGKVLWRLAGLLLLMLLFLTPLLVGSSNASSFPPHPPAGALALAEAMTFAWGFVLCAFSLWVSANTRRSVTSAALIFVSLLVVLVLLPSLLSMLGGPGSGQADYAGNYPAWMIMHVNAFYALSRITATYNGYASGSNPNDGDPLHGTQWGLLQIALYLVGAGVFLYVSYRSLKIWEEPKHRLG